MGAAIEDAIHLVCDGGDGNLLGAGARRGHIFSTMHRFTVGPCDRDPDRHRELRRAWEVDHVATLMGVDHIPTGFFGVDGVGAAISRNMDVVLWGTRGFVDLAWLWWGLDTLARLRPSANRLFLARPGPEDPLATHGGIEPAESKAAFAAKRPIGQDDLSAGAELWGLFASPSPIAFDEARRAGSAVFPELRTCAEPHGYWFPRLRGDRLRLSVLDEALLASVTDGWLDVTELYRRVEPGALEQLVSAYSVFLGIERLRAWAEHGALERRDHPTDNPYERCSFRATDRTRHLLADGLDSVADAPPMFVGGCRINDPAAPFVRLDDDVDAADVDGGGWRLAALPT